jgi:hypothetical protein
MGDDPVVLGDYLERLNRLHEQVRALHAEAGEVNAEIIAKFSPYKVGEVLKDGLFGHYFLADSVDGNYAPLNDYVVFHAEGYACDADGEAVDRRRRLSVNSKRMWPSRLVLQAV